MRAWCVMEGPFPRAASPCWPELFGAGFGAGRGLNELTAQRFKAWAASLSRFPLSHGIERVADAWSDPKSAPDQKQPSQARPSDCLPFVCPHPIGPGQVREKRDKPAAKYRDEPNQNICKHLLPLFRRREPPPGMEELSLMMGLRRALIESLELPHS